MIDFSAFDDAAFELASVYLDHEATADERAQVEQSPALVSLVNALRGVSAQVAAPLVSGTSAATSGTLGGTQTASVEGARSRDAEVAIAAAVATVALPAATTPPVATPPFEVGSSPIATEPYHAPTPAATPPSVGAVGSVISLQAAREQREHRQRSWMKPLTVAAGVIVALGLVSVISTRGGDNKTSAPATSSGLTTKSASAGSDLSEATSAVPAAAIAAALPATTAASAATTAAAAATSAAPAATTAAAAASTAAAATSAAPGSQAVGTATTAASAGTTAPKPGSTNESAPARVIANDTELRSFLQSNRDSFSSTEPIPACLPPASANTVRAAITWQGIPAIVSIETARPVATVTARDDCRILTSVTT